MKSGYHFFLQTYINKYFVTNIKYFINVFMFIFKALMTLAKHKLDTLDPY